MRDRGKEYGAVTGRPRRCGWLDLAILRYAMMVNGITSLVVTKLDVFDTQREIQVCVGYCYKGTPIHGDARRGRGFRARHAPNTARCRAGKSATEGVREAEELPQAALRLPEVHLRPLEVEIGMISTGPERDATIVAAGTQLASWL